MERCVLGTIPYYLINYIIYPKITRLGVQGNLRLLYKSPCLGEAHQRFVSIAILAGFQHNLGFFSIVLPVNEYLIIFDLI